MLIIMKYVWHCIRYSLWPQEKEPLPSRTNILATMGMSSYPHMDIWGHKTSERVLKAKVFCDRNMLYLHKPRIYPLICSVPGTELQRLLKQNS